MRVERASFDVLTNIDGDRILKCIERYARVCYKSEGKINDDSAEQLIRSIIKMGHESVIEHESISVHVKCDRGVSHEIVRHRIASYSQESTRYCNYCDNRFGNELTFIKPCFWTEESDQYNEWFRMMQEVEESYIRLIKAGAKPQEARSILPNSLKTEIVITMNLREWRHFFKLRTDSTAHPQMREITIPMLNRFRDSIPLIFEDINV